MPQNHLDRRSAAVRTSALRAGSIYLLVGILWIVLSDRVLATVAQDIALLSEFQTLKGWLFVAASAVLIWWLVRREVRRVQESEAQLAALGDQGIAGTYVVVDGRFARVNARFAEIFGYPIEQIEGMSALDVVVEADRDRIRASISESESGWEDLARYRFTGRRGDGSTVDVESFGRAVEWLGGRAVAGVVLDVSDRVQLQQQLRQAARVDELGNLTGAVAHDFNNFLTGILGNLDLMLQDRAGGSSELRANLELVRDSAARAASLTGQLLAFSRGGAFHHRPIDPNRHLEELSRFLESLCQGGQTLALDLEEGLPAVVLDPVALDQLVVNLFVNAKDAVGKRGKITIRTRSERPRGEPPEVHIEVADDGIGMSPAVQARIFEPFFTTKERGTGLGLATVRGIVDEVRGHLSVDTEDGRGTTVRVSLSATSAGAADAPGVARVATVTALANPAATILVVDDDASVRKVVSSALTRIGHRTLSAATAGEAERTLTGIRGDVDLLICDVNLPDLTGPELVRRIRREHPTLRVLFTSGCRPNDDGEHADLLAASPFLDKPFSLDDLRTAVAGALAPPAEERLRESSAG
jgi:PAS domain S-box-containing protein